ncbi:hypothetical protein [Saccharomonospora viridis]|uniref:hypothetical protein n=1 Tax=Saccharomonospora viridis TaxID=1852 RepID=UPI0024094791|nr:hypothetical protein [Saccharomonospora viridis]
MSTTELRPTPLRRQILNDIAHGRIITARRGRLEQTHEGQPGPLSKTAEAAVKELRREGMVLVPAKPGQALALTLEGKMAWARWSR